MEKVEMKEKNDELISIIVPVYNAEKYLDRCVKSILSQTYPNIEIILVNDGSKDNSEAICKKWVKKDKRVTLINKENGGASSARNLGIEKAKGKFVQFVDADDFIEENYTMDLYNPIKSDKSIDLVVGGFVIDKKGISDVYMPSIEAVYSKTKLNNKDLLFSLIWGHFAFLDSPINKLYRKEKMPRFDLNICISEDKAFNIKVLEKVDKIAIVKSKGYHYLMNDGSLSHRKYEKLHKDLQFVDDLLINYVQANIEDDCSFELNHIVFETFLRCVRHYIGQKMDKKFIVDNIKEMLENTNFNKILSYKSESIKEKIVKSMIKNKRYFAFINFYKTYIRLKRIDVNKI